MPWPGRKVFFYPTVAIFFINKKVAQKNYSPKIENKKNEN
jgi:hypothetical protein